MLSNYENTLITCGSDGTPKLSSDDSLRPPCQAACPLHIDVRAYVDLIARGRVMEALQVIRESNPFPAICAHVCTHACEESCRRIQVDKPIAIRALERFAVEFGGDRKIQPEAKTTREQRIAIVGSGPAGMACAYYLRKLGYPVSVFEAHSELGGMLRVGIPWYRLPRDILDLEVQRLIQMGVEIRTNSTVISLDLLFNLGYKAIFIAVGAHQSLRPGIKGEENPGVVEGAAFLREVNLGLKPPIGAKVIVIGGGRIAVDAARTALRLGAGDVKILYPHTSEELPTDTSEIRQAREEGVETVFLVTPTAIGKEDGQLTITCIRIQPGKLDASGRPQSGPVPGSEFYIRTDTVITATGQAPRIPLDFRLRVDPGGTIHSDPTTHATSREGVFAGGDAVTGPATVVQALATGRHAAAQIDDYLQHRVSLSDNKERILLEDLLPETVELIKKLPRGEPPVFPPQERAKGFGRVELSYDWDTAINEAKRCLRCGTGAEILFHEHCATCLTCLRICPYHVPYLDVWGTVQIPAGQCLACGICVSECPAKTIVLRQPQDRQQIGDGLELAFKSAARTKSKPLIIGFCCQYELHSTGALASLCGKVKEGILIAPVLCVARIETQHILHAFAIGAEGVFIAGCGQGKCTRENTSFWALQRIARARQLLKQIGLEPERVQGFNLCTTDESTINSLDRFTEQIGELCLASVIKGEVKIGKSSREKY